MFAPDYYAKFKCTGPECPDCCCNGWRITMNRSAYHKLKSNRHPAIAPLVKQYVQRISANGNRNPAVFAQMGFQADGNCGLLDTDGLCLIQKTVGSAWMPPICNTYPRVSREVDGNLECSLGLSCPEVAKLALTQRTPIQFIEIADDHTMGVNLGEKLDFGDPTATDIRNLCIAILQAKNYSVDARMLLLGEFLSGIDQLAANKRTDLVPGLASNVIAYLSGERDYSTEAARYRADPKARLQFIGEALTVLFDKKAPRLFGLFVSGFMESFGINDTTDINALVAGYQRTYVGGGKNFLSTHAQLFENYLVSLAFTNGLALHYKEPKQAYASYLRLVLYYGMIKLLAIGIAAHPAGAEEKDLVALIHTFSRHAEHNKEAFFGLLKHVIAQGHGNFPFIATTLLEID